MLLYENAKYIIWISNIRFCRQNKQRKDASYIYTNKRHVKELGNVISNKRREGERERNELRDASRFLPGMRNARRSREFIPSAITPRFWPGKYRRENARMESTWPEAHRRDGDPQPPQFRAFALPGISIATLRDGVGGRKGFKQCRDSTREHERVYTYIHRWKYKRIAYTRMHVTAFTLNPICLG